jgi:uncharacterized membrane protein YhaH (DUF805 family)
MSEINRYRAPGAQVDGATEQEFAEVKVFGVDGRVGRIRYLAYYIGVSFVTMLIVMMLGGIAAAALGQVGATIAAILFGIAYIFILVYSFMVTIQRAHDFNTSGWLSLLLLVFPVSLIFLFIPGTKGANDYGAPPPPNNAGNYILALVMPFVLVGAIGIMAAVAIPAYNGYIAKAKEMQQQQQQQQQQLQGQQQQQ